MKLRIATDYSFNVRNQAHLIEAHINGSINHLEFGFLVEHAKRCEGLICDQRTYATWIDSLDAKDSSYYDEFNGKFITEVKNGLMDYPVAEVEMDVNTGISEYLIMYPTRAVDKYDVTEVVGLNSKNTVSLFNGEILLIVTNKSNEFKYLEFNPKDSKYTVISLINILGGNL